MTAKTTLFEPATQAKDQILFRLLRQGPDSLREEHGWQGKPGSLATYHTSHWLKIIQLPLAYTLAPCSSLIGQEAMTQIMWEYFEENPPQHYLLTTCLKRLPFFIRQRWPEMKPVADLAMLALAHLHVTQSHNPNRPANLDPTHLKLTPSHLILRLETKVTELFRQLNADSEPISRFIPEQEEWVLIAQTHQGPPVIHLIDPHILDFVKSLSQGCALALAVEQFAADSGIVEDHVAAFTKDCYGAFYSADHGLNY